MLFTFIFLPASLVLFILGLVTRKAFYFQLLGVLWTGLLGLVLVVFTLQRIFGKSELSRDDVYGQYVVDRTKAPGKQADWQYQHYRFEIKPNDSIYFYETDNERILKTYKGTVSFLEAYQKPRIVISIQEPRSHIIENKPTLYSRYDPFYYVFWSPKFGNVFFTKGEWKKVTPK
ncbi:hypothetical protein GU926_15845 [Nibribacter ruber]|uniref:Uncharacterized protein n=1 Tax=Nibribacter ruber TaxID=2698458 RepID=A0A6P1P333_9BACT|nr:hypothetical protein [Nibribacter ruber]QHL88817.1 hypothetical protein GU926_15845 [Nibribacter ruber]